MMRSDRRQFLWLTAGAGAALGLGGTAWLMRSGDVLRVEQSNGLEDVPSGLQSASRTSWALGSDVTMTALHGDRRIAQAAIDAAFDELELVEQLMSIYRPQSQLSQLNRDGWLDDPHPYLIEVLRAAEEMSRRTTGAFDITVQPLWVLFTQAVEKNRLPENAAVLAECAKVGWRRVEISTKRIRLNGNGVAVTLNGIAQGFAADMAAAALRARGVEHALVNTGEIGTVGNKKNGEPWTVGIQHPRQEDAYLSLAKLAGRCLATSGDYATSFTPDHRLHHLFDPHTGRSPDELSSVSIAAPSAMQADALSTAVFVLGMEQGIELVRATPGVDALLVLKDGTTAVTPGFPLETPR